MIAHIEQENNMINNMKPKALALIIVLVSYMYTSLVWSDSNVLFIIDVSERMSGKFPDHTKLKDLNKIETATASLEAMLEKLPKDLIVGLEAYGHKGEKDCSAVEILNPLSPLDTESIIDKMDQLVSDRGSAPLAKALQQGSDALSQAKGKKTIILFSDGIDTCGGDIEEVINQLKTKGVTVNVVGIDIKEDEVAELSNIATANNGLYYAVNNLESMEESLKSIVEKIEDKSFNRPFFRDDFVEESLSSQWQVLNPEKKQLQIKEGGLVFTTTANKPSHVNNTLRIDTPAKDTNWAITANLSVTPQTMREVFELGISNKDESHLIFAQLNINPEGYILLKGVKRSKKSTSSFKKKLISYKSRDQKASNAFLKQHIQSLIVKIEKVNKEYTISARINPLLNTDTAIASDWVVLQKINAASLPNEKFFIKAYAVNISHRNDQKKSGKIALKWVEVKTE